MNILPSKIKSSSIIANILLLLSSIILGVVIVELIFLGLRDPVEDYLDRYYLLSGTEGVFKEGSGLVLYKNNSKIKHEVYYDDSTGFKKEYGYEMQTNNFGFVQEQDLDINKKSVLFLGDSFTEGTGAPPWFNVLTKNLKNNDIQLINGGILGTGFSHWFNIHNYLRDQGLAFEKVFILYISDDISRKNWSFNTDVHDCINNWQVCRGWEPFSAIPPQSELLEYLHNIRTFRMESRYVFGNFKETIKKVLPGLLSIYRFVLILIQSDKTVSVIDFFAKSYADQLYFIRIPQKHELEFGYDSKGSKAQSLIDYGSSKSFDLLALCDFRPEDYYAIDGHFNVQGYAKLERCVRKIYLEVM